MKSTASLLLLSFVIQLKANRLLQQVIPSPTCSLPAETGLCKAAFIRYFYNSLTKKCETFTYGGCGGNANNFQTLLECQAFVTQNCDSCPNGCITPITRECSQFAPCAPREYCQTTDPNALWYITCPAYPNAKCNFNGCGWCGEYWTDSLGNIVDCNVDICTLPADVGPCDGAFYNYFYNAKTGKCDKFTFGGCDGNANNFETLEACRAVEAKCKPDVGCGIDNCIKYTDGCNECTCNADGTESCTEKACIETVVFVRKCLDCEFGYRLDENDKCVKKKGCENSSDCDRPEFRCNPDPICRVKGRNNPNCTPRPRVCYAKGGRCTSDADCDGNNGFKCIGINNQGTGVCTKYQ